MKIVLDTNNLGLRVFDIPYPLRYTVIYTTPLELTTHLLKFELNAHFLDKKSGFWAIFSNRTWKFAENLN